MGSQGQEKGNFQFPPNSVFLSHAQSACNLGRKPTDKVTFLALPMLDRKGAGIPSRTSPPSAFLLGLTADNKQDTKKWIQ